MTAQINDDVFHRKINFSIAGIKGSGLFEPKRHKIKPSSMSTACWRGYFLSYAIEDGRLFLTRVTVGLSGSQEKAARAGKGPPLFGQHPRHDDGPMGGWVYDHLRQPIPFCGSLLLGAEFIDELYVHMGFHPGWKYRDVREVFFEHGRVTDDLDLSEKMRDLRAELSAQPLKPGLGPIRLFKWVKKCFSRDYK